MRTTSLKTSKREGGIIYPFLETKAEYLMKLWRIWWPAADFLAPWVLSLILIPKSLACLHILLNTVSFMVSERPETRNSAKLLTKYKDGSKNSTIQRHIYEKLFFTYEKLLREPQGSPKISKVNDSTFFYLQRYIGFSKLHTVS